MQVSSSIACSKYESFQRMRVYTPTFKILEYSSILLICELCQASFGSYEILEYSTISVSENLKPRDFEKLVLPVAYF